MVVPTSHSQLLLQDRRLQFISSRNGEDSRGFEVREAMQAFINLQSAELTAAVRADRSVVSRSPAELKSNEADLLREADRARPRDNKGSRLDTSSQIINHPPHTPPPPATPHLPRWVIN